MQPTREAVRQSLEKLLASRVFQGSERMSRFLRFSVEHALRGEPAPLKEYVIGVQVFDRGESFDPRTDTIVRVEARRLRAKLKEYYAAEGRRDPVVIGLSEKGYHAVFSARAQHPFGLGINNQNTNWRLIKQCPIPLFSFTNPCFHLFSFCNVSGNMNYDCFSFGVFDKAS